MKKIIAFFFLCIVAAAVLAERLSPCDTWVALPDSTKCGCTILGKNSDRLYFGCQPLFLHPRKRWPAGSKIDLGRVSIPQVDETFATLGSSPYWCWGYEEGINEHGVAIGNEGIRTKVLVEDIRSHLEGNGPKPGPTGMDLLRLGLERGRTAREALDVIAGLVEEHGQFGSGMPMMSAPLGGYDNSYIVADAKEAWVLETAGKHWVAKRFEQGVASISNTLSIGPDWDLASPRLVTYAVYNGWWSADDADTFDFTRAYLDDELQGANQRLLSLPRADQSKKMLEQEKGGITPRWMMRIARDRASLLSAIDRENTASSCVAILPKSDKGLPVFWWCPSVPSKSCYIPFFVHGSVIPEAVSTAGTFGRKIVRPLKAGQDRFSADSYWWLFRRLCDLIKQEPEARKPIARAEFDGLEKAFEAELPTITNKAAGLISAGKREEAATVLDGFTSACVQRTTKKAEELCKRFERKADAEETRHTGEVAESAEKPGMQEKRIARLKEKLELNRVEHHIPGMALAVVKDDEVVLAHGFGLADLENGKPVTPDTLFAIGSTTKAFTATLISMLVEEGRMEWDDRVTRYLPDFELSVDSKDDDAAAAISDLLSHRTGFTRMGMLFQSGTASRDDILRIASIAEPWSVFRKEFHYCNIMYLAAGVAAGVAAGADWNSLVRERILGPLGMDDSSTSVTECMGNEHLSLGYMWEKDIGAHRQLPMRNVDNVGPAGSINSNVIDMAKWIRFLLSGGAFEGRRLISEAGLRETWTKKIDMGSAVGYGYGWFIREWNGQLLVEHGGNIDGFAAQVALLPESGVGFVLLANLTSSPLQRSSISIVFDAMLGEFEEKSRPPGGGKGHAPFLGGYMANFGNFKDVTYEVIVKNGRLAVDVPGQITYELKDPDEEGKRYFAISSQVAVSFVQNDKGGVTGMKLYQGGLTFNLPKADVEIVPEVPLDELESYLGPYWSDEMNETVELVIKNNCLALAIPGQKTYELHAPNEEGKWVFCVVDWIAVSFAKDDNGRVVSMTYYERDGRIEYKRVETNGAENPATLEEILTLRDAGRRKEALLGMGCFRLQGKMWLKQSGLEGSVTVHASGTDCLRTEVDYGAFGRIETVVTENKGWIKQAFGRVDELRGKFREQSMYMHPLAICGDWRGFFDSVSVIRSGDFDGCRVHILKLHSEEAPDYTVYVDADNGDVLKAETSLIHPGTMIMLPHTIRFEDFRNIGGLRIPFRVISKNEAAGCVLTQYLRIKTNIEAEGELFSEPPG